MENSLKNNLFKESLLSSGNNLNSTLLKTVPSTEINNIIGNEKKSDDIQEIYDRYNDLKKKINLLLNNI
jgi:hypothetical protein